MKNLTKLGLTSALIGVSLCLVACKSEEQKHKEAYESLIKEQKERANSKEAKERELEILEAEMQIAKNFGSDTKEYEAKIEQLKKEISKLK